MVNNNNEFFIGDLAPIVLFTYIRLDILKKCIHNLLECPLASESELYIFSDGSKEKEHENNVNRVREFIREIKGFKKIIITESDTNIGLANSIINGVNQIINKFQKVIVLEDDLLVSKNFLSYMNQALEFYSNNNLIFSISGYSPNIEGINENDVYFTNRSSSWGWATWIDRWNLVDWNVNDYEKFSNDLISKNKFNKMGSDMTWMLNKQMNGEINSWAIRWCFSQFKNNLFTVFPAKSKVLNIGFGSELATHTKESNNSYFTLLDESSNTTFNFSNKVNLNDRIISQFVKSYSFKSRLKNKLLNYNILSIINSFIKLIIRKH